MAAVPNVTVQVIPYDAGAHPGMPGSFIVLEFPDPADQGLVYIDSMAGDVRPSARLAGARSTLRSARPGSSRGPTLR
jgi:hypothetical protein